MPTPMLHRCRCDRRRGEAAESCGRAGLAGHRNRSSIIQAGRREDHRHHAGGGVNWTGPADFAAVRSAAAWRLTSRSPAGTGLRRCSRCSRRDKCELRAAPASQWFAPTTVAAALATCSMAWAAGGSGRIIAPAAHRGPPLSGARSTWWVPVSTARRPSACRRLNAASLVARGAGWELTDTPIA